MLEKKKEERNKEYSKQKEELKGRKIELINEKKVARKTKKEKKFA